MGLSQEPTHRLQQFVPRDRLCDESPSRHFHLLVLRLRISNECGDERDRDRLSLCVLQEPLRYLRAVHPGHFDIEEDEVGSQGFGQSDALKRFRGARHLVPPRFFECPTDKGAETLLVVDHKDPLYIYRVHIIIYGGHRIC